MTKIENTKKSRIYKIAGYKRLFQSIKLFLISCSPAELMSASLDNAKIVKKINCEIEIKYVKLNIILLKKMLNLKCKLILVFIIKL